MKTKIESGEAISFSGKAGDVSSMTTVAKAVTASIDRPPAEALASRIKNDHGYSTSVWKELRQLFGPIAKLKETRRIYLLMSGAALAVILHVTGELRMNIWQGAFYRAIEQKILPDIGKQSLFFIIIMLIMLSFVVAQNWLLERLKIRMRERLSHTLLDEWMKPGHAYRLNMTSEEQLNPDQRIQEDIKNFSEFSGDLGMGLLRATLMLISFVGVLWMMSDGITLPLGDRHIAIPGYMVWFALIYAGIGSWLAARVGRPLIDLNEQRYTREANFRYSLVRVSDNAESIAFYSGEKDERKIVNTNLDRVLATMKTLSFANARLTWIACGHGWMVVILPVLVALPGYLQGKLDFGGLMMVVGAFNNVQQSLRWIVENFGKIADWRATLHRVSVFLEAVKTVDDYETQPETIALVPHKLGHLSFEKTSISLLDGQVVIAEATAEINPGERVLLVGESGSGKSTLLRAVGGLWPWGSGKINLPPKNETMFLPQKPYIPLGTLAAALSYPRASETWDHSELERCLKRVNLESFIPLLNEVARWDKMMSLGQQQRLAFARLLLHKPRWVFLDEATSALDDENQERVMSIFTDELKGSALLSIGHRSGLEAYHTRTLHLLQTSSGRILSRKPKAKAKISGKIKRKLVENLVAANQAKVPGSFCGSTGL